MFQNKIEISPPVIPVSLAKYLQIVKKLRFIYNDKHISDSNAYNAPGIGSCEMDCDKESHCTKNEVFH